MKLIVELIYIESPQKKSHLIQWAQVPSTSLVTFRVFLYNYLENICKLLIELLNKG